MARYSLLKYDATYALYNNIFLRSENGNGYLIITLFSQRKMRNKEK